MLLRTNERRVGGRRVVVGDQDAFVAGRNGVVDEVDLVRGGTRSGATVETGQTNLLAFGLATRGGVSERCDSRELRNHVHLDAFRGGAGSAGAGHQANRKQRGARQGESHRILHISTSLFHYFPHMFKYRELFS